MSTSSEKKNRNRTWPHARIDEDEADDEYISNEELLGTDPSSPKLPDEPPNTEQIQSRNNSRTSSTSSLPLPNASGGGKSHSNRYFTVQLPNRQKPQRKVRGRHKPLPSPSTLQVSDDSRARQRRRSMETIKQMIYHPERFRLERAIRIGLSAMLVKPKGLYTETPGLEYCRNQSSEWEIPQLGKFSLTIHLPGVFKAMRAWAQVRESRFFSSLCGQGLILDCKPKGGKSGECFYITPDQRFVLKSVSNQEMTLLLDRFAMQLLNHFNHNPNSLITPFLILFTLSIFEEKPVTLVCMPNTYDVFGPRTILSQLAHITAQAQALNSQPSTEPNSMCSTPTVPVIKKVNSMPTILAAAATQNKDVGSDESALPADTRKAAGADERPPSARETSAMQNQSLQNMVEDDGDERIGAGEDMRMKEGANSSKQKVTLLNEDNISACRFDLKGLAARCFVSTAAGNGQKLQTDDVGHEADMLKSNQRIWVFDAQKRSLQKQLSIDLEFLSGCQIVDYSLLLLVSEHQPPMPPPPQPIRNSSKTKSRLNHASSMPDIRALLREEAGMHKYSPYSPDSPFVPPRFEHAAAEATPPPHRMAPKSVRQVNRASTFDPPNEREAPSSNRALQSVLNNFGESLSSPRTPLTLQKQFHLVDELGPLASATSPPGDEKAAAADAACAPNGPTAAAEAACAPNGPTAAAEAVCSPNGPTAASQPAKNPTASATSAASAADAECLASPPPQPHAASLLASPPPEQSSSNFDNPNSQKNVPDMSPQQQKNRLLSTPVLPADAPQSSPSLSPQPFYGFNSGRRSPMPLPPPLQHLQQNNVKQLAENRQGAASNGTLPPLPPFSNAVVASALATTKTFSRLDNGCLSFLGTPVPHPAELDLLVNDQTPRLGRQQTASKATSKRESRSTSPTRVDSSLASTVSNSSTANSSTVSGLSIADLPSDTLHVPGRDTRATRESVSARPSVSTESELTIPPCTDPPVQCYTLAIVDIFQEYNAMRRMESVMKSLYKEATIVPPNQYASRLRQFVDRIVMVNERFECEIDRAEQERQVIKMRSQVLRELMLRAELNSEASQTKAALERFRLEEHLQEPKGELDLHHSPSPVFSSARSYTRPSRCAEFIKHPWQPNICQNCSLTLQAHQARNKPLASPTLQERKVLASTSEQETKTVPVAASTTITVTSSYPPSPTSTVTTTTPFTSVTTTPTPATSAAATTSTSTTPTSTTTAPTTATTATDVAAATASATTTTTATTLTTPTTTITSPTPTTTTTTLRISSSAFQQQPQQQQPLLSDQVEHSAIALPDKTTHGTSDHQTADPALLQQASSSSNLPSLQQASSFGNIPIPALDLGRTTSSEFMAEMASPPTKHRKKKSSRRSRKNSELSVKAESAKAEQALEQNVFEGELIPTAVCSPVLDKSVPVFSALLVNEGSATSSPKSSPKSSPGSSPNESPTSRRRRVVRHHRKEGVGGGRKDGQAKYIGGKQGGKHVVKIKKIQKGLQKQSNTATSALPLLRTSSSSLANTKELPGNTGGSTSKSSSRQSKKHSLQTANRLGKSNETASTNKGTEQHSKVRLHM